MKDNIFLLKSTRDKLMKLGETDINGLYEYLYKLITENEQQFLEADPGDPAKADTIQRVIGHFVEKEEYEKCEKLHNISKKL